MTKQVQLSDDAYTRLAAEKRQGESFSDVVLRLTRKAPLRLDLDRTEAEVQAHERLLREMEDLNERTAPKPWRPPR